MRGGIGISTFVLVAPLALAVAIACGSDDSSSSNGGECLVGSERCPCTQGGACDPGLSCRSEVCVRLPGAPGAGGKPSNWGGKPQGSGDGGSGDGGPASGGTGSPPDGGPTTGGAGGTATGSGGQPGSGGAPAVPATCPFPAGSVRATEDDDPLGQSLDTLNAVFSSGTLVELDGRPCTIDTSGIVPTGDWGGWPCKDAYDCGGCIVFVIGPDGANAPGNWFLLGEHSGTYGASNTCPTLSASYDMCAPDCDGKQCGSDGCGSFCGVGCGSGRCCNPASQCVVDTCSQCLATCSGDPDLPPIPNCCTGVGCICAGDCPGPC